MAAGEDEAEPIVLDGFRVGKRSRIFSRNLGSCAGLVERGETLLAPQTVDRLEPSSRDEPGPRVRGHALSWPLLERGPERIVQGFFRHVEVAEQPDERGEDAARFRQIDSIHRLVDLIGSGHSERSDHDRARSLNRYEFQSMAIARSV